MCPPVHPVSLHVSLSILCPCMCPCIPCQSCVLYVPMQAAGMFVGEMSCFVVFQIWYWSVRLFKGDTSQFGPQKFNPLVFLIPACCDLTGTSLMYVGLNLTFASSFQMLRGSVIIFTGLLSVAFLRNKLYLFHWTGMICVVIGLVVVGLGDVLPLPGEEGKSSDNSIPTTLVISGDLLIIIAQIIASIQMTFEEKVVKKYDVPPLQGVGWEGIFGFSILFVLLFPFYFIPWHLPAGNDFWQPFPRFEDSIDAFNQIGNMPLLAVAVFGTVVSIAFFNFAGLTVTQKMSATTRMVLDSVRTLFIWIISVSVGWQKFNFMQPIGFVMLVVGTFIYYNLVFAPILRKLNFWPKFCMTAEEKAKLERPDSPKPKGELPGTADEQKKPLLTRHFNTSSSHSSSHQPPPYDNIN